VNPPSMDFSLCRALLIDIFSIIWMMNVSSGILIVVPPINHS
jgi:hypothetical protein